MSRFEKLTNVRKFDLLISIAPFYRDTLPEINQMITDIMRKVDKAKFHQCLGEMMVATKTFSLIKVKRPSYNSFKPNFSRPLNSSMMAISHVAYRHDQH